MRHKNGDVSVPFSSVKTECDICRLPLYHLHTAGAIPFRFHSVLILFRSGWPAVNMCACTSPRLRLNSIVRCGKASQTFQLAGDCSVELTAQETVHFPSLETSVCSSISEGSPLKLTARGCSVELTA